MPGNGQQPPIEISTTPLTASTWTGLRYAVSLILTWAAAKGWLPAEQVGEITGHVVAILLALYAVWKSFTRQTVTIVAADAANDRVATVTGGAKDVAEKLKA